MAGGAAAGAAAGSWAGPPGMLTGAALGFIGDVISGASSAKRAKAQRNWEERMSNTSYQRQVADLRAAGLNPALGISKGSGASTPSTSAAPTPDFGRAGDRFNTGRINSAQAGLLNAETFKATQEGRSAQAAAELAEYDLGNKKFAADLDIRNKQDQNLMLAREIEDLEAKYDQLHRERAAQLAEFGDKKLGYAENVRERERKEQEFQLREKGESLRQRLEAYKIPAAQVDAAINTGNWNYIMSRIRSVTGAAGDITGAVTNTYGLGAILNSAKRADTVMQGPWKIDRGTGEILNVPGNSPSSSPTPYRPDYSERAQRRRNRK